jgi:hypothetical protein
MNVHGILHLTVNADGRLSLWDSPDAALRGKETDEINVQVSLTADQMRLVLRAQALARSRKLSGV